MGVTKRELFTMSEHDSELILNPLLKNQKDKVELKELKEKVINSILDGYSNFLKNILDSESNNVVWDNIWLISEESLKSKQKIISVKNIVSAGVLKLLLKSESNSNFNKWKGVSKLKYFDYEKYLKEQKTPKRKEEYENFLKGVSKDEWETINLAKEMIIK